MGLFFCEGLEAHLNLYEERRPTQHLKNLCMRRVKNLSFISGITHYEISGQNGRLYSLTINNLQKLFYQKPTT